MPNDDPKWQISIIIIGIGIDSRNVYLRAADLINLLQQKSAQSAISTATDHSARIGSIIQLDAFWTGLVWSGLFAFLGLFVERDRKSLFRSLRPAKSSPDQTGLSGR